MIAVCSEIHAKKKKNSMHCGQNTEVLYVKLGGT